MKMLNRWRGIRRWLGPALILAGLGIGLGAAQNASSDRPGPDSPAEAAPTPDPSAGKPEAADAGLAGTAALAAPAEQRPATPVAIERQPYHVEVLVSFENAPHFNDEFRRSVLEGIREAAAGYVGGYWQCTIAEEQGELFLGVAGLRRLRAETLLREVNAGGVDKVFMLSVEGRGAGFEIAGREWDTLTRQLGTMLIERVYDRRAIPETVLDVLHGVFRPIVAVDASKTGALTLRARGGEYPPRDERWLPLAPGKTFEVFYCFLNKERVVERIQQVPFTYLAAEDEAERGVATGRVTSGLRAPLTPRRRIQIIALGINSRAPETRLTLITRPPARKPLAGVEVEVFSTTAPADAGQAGLGKTGDAGKDLPGQANPRLARLVADRNGFVKLDSSYSPSGLPVWLVVKSGQALLARVPLVPGAQGAEVLELPDDTLRLETEGSIAALQAELVDTVARRAVLMSLAKARAKAADWDGVAQLFKQIDGLPKAASIAAEVNAIRLPALKTARARRDRNTEARIQKLCDETLELATNYLDTERVNELREELDESRRILADEAAAEAAAKNGGPKPAETGQPALGVKKKKKKTAAQPAGPPKNPAGF